MQGFLTLDFPRGIQSPPFFPVYIQRNIQPPLGTRPGRNFCFSSCNWSMLGPTEWPLLAFTASNKFRFLVNMCRPVDTMSIGPSGRERESNREGKEGSCHRGTSQAASLRLPIQGKGSGMDIHDDKDIHVSPQCATESSL